MNRIEKEIKEYDNAICGCNTTFSYHVTDKIELKEGATLYLFEGIDNDANYVASSLIEHASGTIMFLSDWQNGRPKDDMEIEDYDWVTSDGREAIMFDGLPRTL